MPTRHFCVCVSVTGTPSPHFTTQVVGTKPEAYRALPAALVKASDQPGANDTIVSVLSLDQELFDKIAGLKTQAIQSWYASAHPGWAIYW